MLKFYHAPFSRAFGTFWLIEELGVDYEMVHVDIRAEGGPSEDYRLIQPSRKVPAIEHDGIVITERAAIAIYLADAFPEAGLAPAVGSVERGPYLTWNVYADSVLDPVICARTHGLDYGNNDYPFGLFEDMVANLERRLGGSRYAAGERFSAADIQLGTAIGYTMNVMKVLPAKDVFKDYVERLEARPAHHKASQKDYEMALAMPFFQERFSQTGKGMD